jgi:hypothetical protein
VISDSERPQSFILAEAEEGNAKVYEIKMSEDDYEDEVPYKEDHLLDSFDEQIDENLEYCIEQDESYVVKESPKMQNEQQFVMYEDETEIEEQQEEQEELQTFDKSPTPQKQLKTGRESLPKQTAAQESCQFTSVTASPTKNIIDPDERYLMSCLPAFKRFTPKQKAYVRMGIERLFYEVEFENVSEPKSKKARMS